MALTRRQQTILNAVTGRYIDTGAPVPSKEVAGTAGLSVSSSTVRSELAVLEDKGYLSHPHTSAGRIPTDMGYREFVDHLMSGAITRPSVPSAALGTVSADDLAEFLRDMLSRSGVSVAVTKAASAAPVAPAETLHVVQSGRGAPVVVIPGSPFNLKITTPEDLLLAEAIFSMRRRKKHASRPGV